MVWVHEISGFSTGTRTLKVEEKPSHLLMHFFRLSVAVIPPRNGIHSLHWTQPILSAEFRMAFQNIHESLATESALAES